MNLPRQAGAAQRPLMSAARSSLSKPSVHMWVYVSVTLMLLLAFAVRLFRLDAQSFWYDEIETIRYARNLLDWDTHPPAYYALMSLVLQVGRSEFILRFPTVLQDMLSVAVVFSLSRRLLGLKTALMAALLVGLSAALVWHAQDMRMYSQQVLSTLLVAYTYGAVLERPTRRRWGVFVLTSLFALYTHLYAVMMLGLLVLHYLICQRKYFRQWFRANAVIAMGYLPWLYVLVNTPAKRIGTERANILLGFPYAFFTFASGYSIGPSVNEIRLDALQALNAYLPILVGLTGVVLVLFVTGSVALWRQDRTKFALLFLWIFLPPFAAVGVPLLRPDLTFNVRYILFCAPPFLILLAHGAVQMRPRWLGIALMSFLLIANALSLFNLNTDPRYAKEDVRGAARYLAAQMRPEDGVVTITVGNAVRWYLGSDRLIVSNLPTRPAVSIFAEAQQAAPDGRLWLVKTRAWQTDPKGVLEGLFLSEYAVGDVAQFAGVTVYELCRDTCP